MVSKSTRVAGEQHLLHLLRSSPRSKPTEATISSLQLQLSRLQKTSEQQTAIIESISLKIDEILARLGADE